jgi:hypothetical protein
MNFISELSRIKISFLSHFGGFIDAKTERIT